ncbi:MAG: hypothetical protein ACTTG9_02540 [Dialister pneumosintes]
MNCYVKLNNIEAPICVTGITSIVEKAKEITTYKEFDKVVINPYRYYSFLGNEMLHVQGKRIEYVYFQH